MPDIYAMAAEKDGEVMLMLTYYTDDHYESFALLYGEE